MSRQLILSSHNMLVESVLEGLSLQRILGGLAGLLAVAVRISRFDITYYYIFGSYQPRII
jgi:hypothetical protein